MDDLDQLLQVVEEVQASRDSSLRGSSLHQLEAPDSELASASVAATPVSSTIGGQARVAASLPTHHVQFEGDTSGSDAEYHPASSAEIEEAWTHLQRSISARGGRESTEGAAAAAVGATGRRGSSGLTEEALAAMGQDFTRRTLPSVLEQEEEHPMEAAVREKRLAAQRCLFTFLTRPLDFLMGRADPRGETLPDAVAASALAMFHDAAAYIPAYRDFLQQQGIDAPSVQQFARVPPITKANYLLRWGLHQRCWQGRAAAVDWVHASSGSSGQPTCWGRSLACELEASVRLEQVFLDNFAVQERTTLAVVCFPLGGWVGGLFTTNCLRHLSTKGYPLTITTPGVQVAEILRFVRELGPLHQQTVLLGYPPFLKGVIDAGLAAGVAWCDASIRLVLAGEVISEEWRSLIAQRAGLSPVMDVVSLYGTADAGVVACETPLSVAARRWLAFEPQTARRLFGKDRLPTLAQYDPSSRLIEVNPEDGTLMLSTLSSQRQMGAPLLRYCIGDEGGITSYEDLLSALKADGFTVPFHIAHTRPLPFVWVFGRSFWTVSLYGANVFVENIMAAVEQPTVAESLTGKFVLFVEEDADRNVRLAVRAELAQGVHATEELAASVAATIVEQLLRLNSEYASYVPEDRRLPLVHLHDFGDAHYFPQGVKHRYTLA